MRVLLSPLARTVPTTTLDADALSALCAAALAAAGARPADAADTARVLVDADAMGIATHGAIRVPGYARRLRSGGIDAHAAPRVEPRAPSLALVDGAHALGPVVGVRALEAALELARATGIAYVGCRRSNHFGALAPYALTACDAGFVMLAGTNASSTMAPWGGAQARMGNNPLCVAAPAPDGRHFILDIAMSVAARGKIRAALAAGGQIPEGWALDRAGRPTTDPAAALDGLLQPLAAHKGSGLALAVDLLAGALTGARVLADVSSWVEHPDAPQGIGHFFVLLDPARLVGREAFAAALARFRYLLQATPALDPARPVHPPGDDLLARRARSLAEGVSLPEALVSDLRALARG